MKRKNLFIIILVTIAALACVLPIYADVNNSNIFEDEALSVINYTPYHADAGIHLEENLYFQKYTLTLHEGVGKIDYCFNKGYLDLVLSNGVVDDLSVSNKDILNFLHAKKTSGDIILSIKTPFKENYVYHDLENPKKVIVLISKKKNPYISKVTIDPGHGGEDPGANRKYKDKTILEKDITLNLALMCEPILRYNGINVVLTRNTDTYMPDCKTESEDLKKRVEIANSSKSDAFISIHVNTNDDSDCSGITIYPNNKQKKSERLGDMINEEFKTKTPWKTADLKQANLYVLQNIDMCGVLLECGFLTNPNDVLRLSDITEVSKMAKNISNGIIRFFKE